jgi:hypothetical protein
MPVSWDKDGYVKFALDYEIDRFAAEGIGVLDGCVVSAIGTDTDVSWTAGSVRHGNGEAMISASSLNLSAYQHALYLRKVLIFVDATDSVVKAVAGDVQAAAPPTKTGRYTRRPVPPDFGGSFALAAGDVVLAEVWLRTTGQYILSTDVTDRRCIIPDMHGAASYIIWKAGSTYKAKNGATGQVPFTGTASAVSASVFAAMTAGGLIHYSTDIFTLPTRLTIPKDLSWILEGEGAPSQESDMWTNSGTIFESNDPTGLLTVDGPPSSSKTTRVILRDIEFRQNVQQTDKWTHCVDLDKVWVGGIERCSVLNILDRSGVAYPMNGTGLSMNNGSLGDSFWGRDLLVSGFGGPWSDPAPHGLMNLGSNHFEIENLHLCGMNRRVSFALHIVITGARSVLKNVQFFQLGEYGADTNAIWLIAMEPGAGNTQNLYMENVAVESYYPATWQGKKAISTYSDGNIRITLNRAYNSNFTSWNPWRADYPANFVLKGIVGGAASASKCPIGFVTNFVDTTNMLISPSPTGTPGATLASGTTYTCEIRSALLYIWGGTVSELLINGISVPTSGTYKLQPGDTVKVTWSGEPNVKCYFEE